MAIFKLFGKVLIPLNPLKKTQIRAFWTSKFKKKFSFFFTKIDKKIISGKKSTFHHFHHFYPLHDLPLPTQILFLPKNCKKNFRVKNYITLGLKWVTRVGCCTTACSYLSLLISHINLAYIDLCKFTYCYKPLQRGLVRSVLEIYYLSCILFWDSFPYW